MNTKKLRRLFAAAIICIFVFSFGFSCAAQSSVDSVVAFREQANDDEGKGFVGSRVEEGEDRPYTCTEPRLVDNADLLTDKEEKDVLKTLNQLSEELEFDIVVVTENSIGSKTAMEYADDYFDNNGYGFGENYDGVLLLVSMENRDYWISTSGFGIEAITTYGGVGYVEDEFLPYLSDGDYAEAFETFAKTCGELVESALDGNIYDRYEDEQGNYYYGYYDGAKEHFTPTDRSFLGMEPPIAFGFSLFIGLVIALFSVSAMKSQLKTVKKEQSASNYVVDGSMQVSRSNDRFLYSNITKTKLADEVKSNSGGSFRGSGGGSHVSSSGRSHGGGGGHF